MLLLLLVLLLGALAPAAPVQYTLLTCSAGPRLVTLPPLGGETLLLLSNASASAVFGRDLFLLPPAGTPAAGGH